MLTIPDRLIPFWGHIKIGAAITMVGVLLFLTWRVYDIGWNRGDKSARLAWRLAEADRAAGIEKQRQDDQAKSDQIHAEKMAEREAQLKQNMNADFQKRLRDERAKAAYDCVIPADGVRLYNQAIGRPD